MLSFFRVVNNQFLEKYCNNPGKKTNFNLEVLQTANHELVFFVRCYIIVIFFFPADEDPFPNKSLPSLRKNARLQPPRPKTSRQLSQNHLRLHGRQEKRKSYPTGHAAANDASRGKDKC